MTTSHEDRQAGRGTSGEPMVVDLSDLSADRTAEAGGKAANLGALIGAGFDVPTGFCITTAAYRLAVQGTAVAGGLVPSGDLPDAAAARLAVLAGTFPVEVAAAVRAAYARWGSDVPVAVRSSATAEDLPGASFAGQQDTYLNVVGIDDRAGRRPPVLGVAVDRPCRRLPLGPGHRRRRSGAGRGGAADGRRRGGRRAVHRGPGDRPATAGRDRRGARDWAKRSSPGRSTPTGSSWTPLPGRVLESRHGATPDFCLTTDQVVALARLGDRVERSFGVPQDIEWAFDDDGHPWLTQSRPITTLFPVPLRRKTLPPERASGVLLREPGAGPAPADHPDRHRHPTGPRLGVPGAGRTPAGPGRRWPRRLRDRRRPGFRRRHPGPAVGHRPGDHAAGAGRDGGPVGGRRPRIDGGRTVLGAARFPTPGAAGVGAGGVAVPGAVRRAAGVDEPGSGSPAGRTTAGPGSRRRPGRRRPDGRRSGAQRRSAPPRR